MTEPKISVGSDPHMFKDALSRAFPEAEVIFDEPADPADDWWIDVRIGEFSTSLVWRRGNGFGMFSSDTDYGDRPDQTFTELPILVRWISHLVGQWGSHDGRMHLSDVRHLVGVQQKHVAAKIGITQAAISKLEMRNDAKLSTITSYIETLGGHVEVKVVFDGFTATVTMPAEEEAAS